MFFAVAALANQVFRSMRAEESARVNEAYRQDMLEIAAEQERVNAEAQVAGRLAEYNEVVATQDVIFGTQGRLEEGSVAAIQSEGERALERDTSLIRAIGATKTQMIRAGAAGQASGFEAEMAAKRSQAVSNALTSISGQVS